MNLVENTTYQTSTENNRIGNDQSLISIFLLCGFSIAVIRTAWLSDDAFITFRTIYNFIHGYGLVWNISERVQAYTHPLWMFVLSGLYFLTREIYYTSLLLSIIVSLGALVVLAFMITRSWEGVLLGITILTLSKAFVEYSTSGLENPLTHLLLALFLFIYLKKPWDTRRVFELSLVSALILLNRMDILLLVIVPLVYVIITVRTKKAVTACAIGFLPFILWEIFSIIYYGFLFPNTAYAKLNTGISHLELAHQGLFYVIQSISVDPITFLGIFICIIFLLISGKRHNLPILLGIIFYLLYIIWIGGDFMSGRLFTPPLFLAVALFSSQEIFQEKRVISLVLVSFFLIIGLSNPESPIRVGKEYTINEVAENKINPFVENGIADERGYYYQSFSGLLNASRGNRDSLSGNLIGIRKDVTQMACGGLGIIGFSSGPLADIIDKCALTDPLLARLPAMYDPAWRIGHFLRKVPEGYLESRLTGENRIKDPLLSLYYDKLVLITQGSLFNLNRLRTIILFNLGRYDYLIDNFSYQYPEIMRIKLSPSDHGYLVKPEFTGDSVNIPVHGIQIYLNSESHSKYIELGLFIEQYKVIFFNEQGELGQLKINSSYVELGNLTYNIITVPESIAEIGYTKIAVIPSQPKDFLLGQNKDFLLRNISLIDPENASLSNLLHLSYFLNLQQSDKNGIEDPSGRLIDLIAEFPAKDWEEIPLEELIDLQFTSRLQLSHLVKRQLTTRLPRNIQANFVKTGGPIFTLLGYSTQRYSFKNPNQWLITFYFKPIRSPKLDLNVENYLVNLQYNDQSIEKKPHIPTYVWVPDRFYRASTLVELPPGEYDFSIQMYTYLDQVKEYLTVKENNTSSVQFHASLR
jgi:arabinofuranosyltransferase